MAHNIFSSICVRKGETVTLPDDCLAKLNEILKELSIEDSTLRTYRRAVGFGGNIKKDLIPLLRSLKDDAKTNTKTIDSVVKILVNLTIPIEYLLPLESMQRTEVGKHTIFELNKLLTNSKEAFTDSRSTKVIMDHIKFIVESDLEMDLECCESINNCLLLLRNILHVPEVKNGLNSPLAHSSMQNQIIWNLFTQSIDKVIIYLISCPQKMYFGVTVVQLIALLYKDQHVSTLQKLLNLWLEASLSDSSEDNESNTSPPEPGSDDSSPIITSDPTSDSSDGGAATRAKTTSNTERNKKTFSGMTRGKSIETEASSSGVSTAHTSFDSIDVPKDMTQSMKNKRDCQSSQSEDFGYATQVENQESISTSSNEEDQPQLKTVHQKSHTLQKIRYSAGKNRNATVLDKKELRRKKLVKRSKTNTINMKGLLHHLPTDENIANILKEFTVDFLLKGYGTLVEDLHCQLLSNIHIQIDTSHFFWLITYFLKFATQLELDLEHVSPVLSEEILSYLVFQAVWIYEELEKSEKIAQIDLKPCLRRLHLAVTAIRECLQAIEMYQKMIHLSEDDRLALNKLQNYVAHMDDLKSLFLLLLRQYNPNIQNRQYLQDLILTNHNYLLFLDATTTKDRQSFNLMEHLKQFATVEIMRQYGLLLENFKENGEFVNNCIFTMMHHIGGDLQHVTTLFQPGILKTFSRIWETDYELCDDWSDLIEYIIHKFINTPRSNSDLNSPSNSTIVDVWTQQEKDNLLGYYNQSRYSDDTIANITKKYEECGVCQKTQISIIKQLLEQNIINERQYNVFVKADQQPKRSKNTKNMSREQNAEEEPSGVDAGIKILRDYLCRNNKSQFVSWLQTVLIETCFVKLAVANPEGFNTMKVLSKPVIYYFALLNLPIPVIPWTSEQTSILKLKSFVLLLHKLGLYLPIDTGKIFVTIPNFWNAEYVFTMAQQLGPIDPDKLPFDVAIFKGENVCETLPRKIADITNYIQRGKFSMNESKQTPTMIRYTPLPNSTEWFQTDSLQSRVLPISEYEVPINSAHPLSITIPGLEECACSLTPPELSIVDNHNMECSPVHDYNECETASIESDLTRMCVSDEEDKLTLVLEQR